MTRIIYECLLGFAGNRNPARGNGREAPRSLAAARRRLVTEIARLFQLANAVEQTIYISRNH